MNLFCIETQQHLPKLKNENSKSPHTIEKKLNPTLLITPDLWFSDESNSLLKDDKKIDKIPKPADTTQPERHISSTTRPSSANEEAIKSPFVQSSSKDHTLPMQKFRSEKVNCLNSNKKRQRTFSNESESSNEQSDNRDSSSVEHSIAMKKPAISKRKEFANCKNVTSKPKRDYKTTSTFDPPLQFPVPNPFDVLARENFGAHNVPKFPLFLQTPFFNAPPQIPNWTKSYNPTIAQPNFNINDPTTIQFLKYLPSQFPFQPHVAPLPQIHNTLTPPSTNMVPYPFIIPVPIPIPIPFPIPEKYLKKNNEKEPSRIPTQPLGQTFKNDETNETDCPISHNTDSIVDPSQEQNANNQALDFSMHRSTASTLSNSHKSSPSTSFSSFNAEPTNVLIKIEPTDTEHEQTDHPISNPIISLNNLLISRPAYAARRSLILDAPQPPQSSSILTTNYANAKRSPHSHNSRKRCHTVQIKAK
ncbi:hypothetical protein HELRODRAFT_167320 [Helobdella robusta]|uniref:Uncharacterized protein n=1 Tax=Helobdella robusta TaxID=6412 RepID=T1EZ92_HELRO|nr:hypothetical protein HELRODRAFT_167320 [Helobdella robusta]ESO10820.1 hypothetical protein HELRODRAFT_167320 [Helobdella robusta]